MKNEKPEKDLTAGEKALITVAFFVIVGVMYLAYYKLNSLWT